MSVWQLFRILLRYVLAGRGDDTVYVFYDHPAAARLDVTNWFAFKVVDPGRAERFVTLNADAEDEGALIRAGGS